MIRILLLLSALALSTHSFASPDRADKMMDKLVERLNLDDAKAEQVRAIFEEGRIERETLRESSREDMAAHRASQEEKLSEVLSEEEMAELRKTMRKLHKKMKGKHHQGEFSEIRDNNS